MIERDDLLKSYKNGELLEAICTGKFADRNDRDAFATSLVELHNEGQIDIVRVFEPLKINSFGGPTFFQARRVLEKVLPDINASVSEVMQCVLKLYHEAGQDGAAGLILSPFMSYCEKEASRPRKALEIIEGEPNEFVELLSPVLISGSRIDCIHYLDQVIRLCKDTNIEVKRRALFSLGGFNWQEQGEFPESCLDLLEQFATEDSDDEILASVVRVGFKLIQQSSSQEERIVSIVEKALAKGGEFTLHSASEIFGFEASNASPLLFDILLVHITRVKPTNKGTINNIDFGIAHLFKSDADEKGIQLLERLLLANPSDLELSDFNVSSGEMLSNAPLTNKVVTRWFLQGEQKLCEGIDDLISKYHSDNLLLEIDRDELNPVNFVQVIFAARKTLGYLLMKPIIAANILISLMRIAPDDETLRELGNLLFDPLLLNYTGKALEYVKQKSAGESGKVKDAINNALKRIDLYLEDLRSVGVLNALHPSEAQREAYNRHFSQLMSESYKRAEAQSVLSSLVAKAVLLYGNKSISYVRKSQGEQPERVEIPMQRHGVEMEFPRMENLDHFGLDYQLRIFRAERFRT